MIIFNCLNCSMQYSDLKELKKIDVDNEYYEFICICGSNKWAILDLSIVNA